MLFPSFLLKFKITLKNGALNMNAWKWQGWVWENKWHCVPDACPSCFPCALHLPVAATEAVPAITALTNYLISEGYHCREAQAIDEPVATPLLLFLSVNTEQQVSWYNPFSFLQSFCMHPRGM